MSRGLGFINSVIYGTRLVAKYSESKLSLSQIQDKIFENPVRPSVQTESHEASHDEPLDIHENFA